MQSGPARPRRSDRMTFSGIAAVQARIQEIEQQAGLVYSQSPSLLAKLDVLLMPLGLAYAKRGQGMPLVVELLQGGLGQSDRRQVSRCR